MDSSQATPRNHRSMWGISRKAFAVVLGTVLTLVFLPSSTQAAPVAWNGEMLVSAPATGNGWEPSIAADPSAPYVYAAWMQYSGAKIYIALRISADGGTTWGASKRLVQSNQGQYDIVLATTSTGVVYATYMQGNHIQFIKSTDHGATWTSPIQISGGTWADKPWLATSATGADVYVTWTTRGDLYAVNSHNSGSAWSLPLKVTSESGMYYYSNGGAVLPGGAAVMVGSEYPESGNATGSTGPVPIVEFRTTNGGTSWTRTVVDTLSTGATYETSSVTTVAADASGTLVLVYSGSTAVGANGHVYVRRSIDSGATWSARTEITDSAGGADATSVAAAGKGSGQFTLTWMDARAGGWNVWQRGSIDGGLTWSADAKVSAAAAGASYKSASGFGLPYGDYDAVAINSVGKTVAIMGEGDATQTKGDIWVNRQS